MLIRNHVRAAKLSVEKRALIKLLRQVKWPVGCSAQHNATGLCTRLMAHSESDKVSLGIGEEMEHKIDVVFLT